MLISIIVAASENNIIGKDGGLPWYLPDDSKFFRKMTLGHPVIMGRKTFESLPDGPLPDRENIIVTHDQVYDQPNCKEASSLEEAVLYAKRKGDAEEVFIIGGGEIYRQAMEIADRIYLTRVHEIVEGDVTFPEIDSNVWEEVERRAHPADERHEFPFTFITYERKDALKI